MLFCMFCFIYGKISANHLDFLCFFQTCHKYIFAKMDELVWTDDDKKRWKTYSNAADEMEKTLGQLKPMLENPDTTNDINPLLELIVSLTQEARFTPNCVLDKVEWCLQGIANTTLKESAMRWLRENITKK